MINLTLKLLKYLYTFHFDLLPTTQLISEERNSSKQNGNDRSQPKQNIIIVNRLPKKCLKIEKGGECAEYGN